MSYNDELHYTATGFLLWIIYKIILKLIKEAIRISLIKHFEVDFLWKI